MTEEEREIVDRFLEEIGSIAKSLAQFVDMVTDKIAEEADEED